MKTLVVMSARQACETYKVSPFLVQRLAEQGTILRFWRDGVPYLAMGPNVLRCFQVWSATHELLSA